MVFVPTFDDISREADALPDLSGDAPDLDAAEIDEGILAGDDDADLPPEGAD